jgi:hypothetical protein
LKLIVHFSFEELHIAANMDEITIHASIVDAKSKIDFEVIDLSK